MEALSRLFRQTQGGPKQAKGSRADPGRCAEPTSTFADAGLTGSARSIASANLTAPGPAPRRSIVVEKMVVTSIWASDERRAA